MRLGIDIDDTIVNTHEVAVLFAKKYAKDLVFNNYEHFETKKAIEFFRKHIEEIQKQVKPLPGVVEALKILKEKGFELIFITARGSSYEFTMDYDYKGITEELFKKYNIPYDKIIYGVYPKGKMASQEKIDLFLDDKEYNLDDIKKYGIKTIKVVPHMKVDSVHKKFDNWVDILNYILEMSDSLNE